MFICTFFLQHRIKRANITHCFSSARMPPRCVELLMHIEPNCFSVCSALIAIRHNQRFEGDGSRRNSPLLFSAILSLPCSELSAHPLNIGARICVQQSLLTKSPRLFFSSPYESVTLLLNMEQNMFCSI